MTWGTGSIRAGDFLFTANFNALPAGWLVPNGAAVSRATYPALFQNITMQSTCTGAYGTYLSHLYNGVYNVNPNFSEIAFLLGYVPPWSAGIIAEAPNIFNSTVTILAAESVSADQGLTNFLDVSPTTPAAAGATGTITFFPYGNGNGSTTFNLPSLPQGTTGPGPNGTGRWLIKAT